MSSALHDNPSPTVTDNYINPVCHAWIVKVSADRLTCSPGLLTPSCAGRSRQISANNCFVALAMVPPSRCAWMRTCVHLFLSPGVSKVCTVTILHHKTSRLPHSRYTSRLPAMFTFWSTHGACARTYQVYFVVMTTRRPPHIRWLHDRWCLVNR